MAQELKVRNVDLAQYMELKQSQKKFEEKIAVAFPVKGKPPKRMPFVLPDYLKDITTIQLRPSTEIIKKDIENLRIELGESKLSDYIDIYNGYAMIKFKYPFSGYFENTLKLKCKCWCERFNLANYALSMVTSKNQTLPYIEGTETYEL